jgi:hypothetical protein
MRLLYINIIFIFLILSGGCVLKPSGNISSDNVSETPVGIQNPTFIPAENAPVVSTQTTRPQLVVTNTSFDIPKQGPSPVSRGETISPYAEYEKGVVIVVYVSNISTTAQRERISAQLNKEIGGIVIENTKFKLDRINYNPVQMIRLPDTISVPEAVAYYERNSSIDYAQPNYVYRIN